MSELKDLEQQLSDARKERIKLIRERDEEYDSVKDFSSSDFIKTQAAMKRLGRLKKKIDSLEEYIRFTEKQIKKLSQ